MLRSGSSGDSGGVGFGLEMRILGTRTFGVESGAFGFGGMG